MKTAKCIYLSMVFLLTVLMVWSCGGDKSTNSTNSTDTTPPTVVSTNPMNGASAVPVNTTISATFSEEMNPSTIAASTFIMNDGVTGAVSYSNEIAIFTPSADLVQNTTYTATITNAVKDAAGNNMTQDYSWVFSTSASTDTTPPTVVSTNPIDGASGVAVTTIISATFSEEMNPSTIAASTFIINNGVTGTVSYSNKIATFTPSTDLVQNTTYTATITNAVKDAAGNNMTQDYSWVFSTSAGSAVTWERTYGGSGDEYVGGIVLTTDGGYVISGSSNSYGQGSYDFYAFKLDVWGNQLWQKTFGTTSGESEAVVAKANNGGFIFVGSTGPDGGFEKDIYYVKSDASGNKVWERTLSRPGIEHANSVAKTPDGGFVMLGNALASTTSKKDVYLVKVDVSGNKVWERTFGGSGSDRGWSIAHTSDGGFIIAGETNSLDPNGDVYLIKTDAGGNQTWEKHFGGSDWDFANSVATTSDGGYIIAGVTYSFAIDIKGIYLVKTDSNGNLVWQKAFEACGVDAAFAIPTSDGGYAISGASCSVGDGSSQAYLIKTDASGNLVWDRMFGGSGHEEGGPIAQTSDGGYIILAFTSTTNSDVYVIKTDANGRL